MLVTGPCRQLAIVFGLSLLALTGCSPFRNAIPAECVRPNLIDAPRASREPINFTRLRQEPPAVYLLGPRDIMGVYIEGVLGKTDEPPPVHFPEQADIPPSIGFPMPVREDGTLSLPLIPPINVTGLTIAQAEHEIREEYTTRRKILPVDHARIILTLQRPREYSVLVVREDTTNIGNGFSMSAPGSSRAAPGFEPERHGTTRQVRLRAYENDVLHALAETGGLPGVDAKNEVIILRGALRNPQMQDLVNRSVADSATRAALFTSGNAIRIPLRISPTDPPVSISQEDVILNTGDIVFVESRNAEVFYTGGLLPGKQLPIPRDYDLDVLAAISMSGGSIAAGPGANINGLGHGGVGSIFPPTRVVVVRSVDGKMVAIKTSLKTAVLDAHERILIQPNDLIILEYTEFELAMNIILNNLDLQLSLNQLFQQ